MRIKILIATSSLLGMTALVSAQPAASDKPVVAVGCIVQAVSNGSLSGGPGVAPATPNNSPALANSEQPTGAFLLAGATAPDASAEIRQQAATSGQTPPAPSLTTYVLDAPATELAPHTGHWMEVTGSLSVMNTGTGSEATAPVNHLRPENLKMLSAMCPQPKLPR